MTIIEEEVKEIEYLLDCTCDKCTKALKASLTRVYLKALEDVIKALPEPLYQSYKAETISSRGYRMKRIYKQVDVKKLVQDTLTSKLREEVTK